jgi:hypothetical protein
VFLVNAARSRTAVITAIRCIFEISRNVLYREDKEVRHPEDFKLHISVAIPDSSMDALDR